MTSVSLSLTPLPVLTVIDIAGADSGGAARWRREAIEWIRWRGACDVRLIGEGERVEPRWLVRREFTPTWHARRIAANNVAFLTGRGPRVVLLRNALHFLRMGEAETLPAIRSDVFRQAALVKRLARRAETIVVPCSDMAERVTAALPRLRARVLVRHHPVTIRVPHQPHAARPYVLYAAPPAAHKNVAGALRQLVAAIDAAGLDLEVTITAPAEELGQLGHHKRVNAIGLQPVNQMDELWASASMAYAPSRVESFGYPLAEARAIGIPIVAADTAQNREIAGSALVGYRDVASLPGAVRNADALRLTPDPEPFNAESYFDWLTKL